MKLKSRSKGTEKEFVKSLEELLKDPTVLVPECLEKAFMCHFEKYTAKLEKALATNSLDRFGIGGDQFLKGVSETARIVDSGNAPLLGVITTPYGNIDYAKRGDTDPAVLAGIQNYKNPLYRGLAFSALVRARGVTIYSSSNYYRSTCRGSSPGLEFFVDSLRDEHIESTLSENEIVVGQMGRNFSLIHNSGIRIIVHEDSGNNTHYRLMKHILCKTPEKEFTIECDLLSEFSLNIPQVALQRYITNQIDDKEFLDKIEESRESEALGKGICFIGSVPYKSRRDFISAIGPEWISSDDLDIFIEVYGKGIRLESPSLRKLLEILWPDFSKQILERIFPGITDDEIRNMKGNPLEKISNYKKELDRRKLKEVFTGKEWSEDSRFLFDCITTLLVEGYDSYARFAERRAGPSLARKSILYAIGKILGRSGEKSWKYSKEEVDMGDGMVQCLADVVNGNLGDVDAMISCIKVYIS
ncbi:MAG: hypothetical protein M1148_03700 [Candidatus Thermoplasmatota archaeon]|nr:hypothetical protein [Candidatus Thermoplasmatota archaeon]MCL5438282.1 hypothetical protein [Candidatus Thermoplasmatota archaeon]